MPSFGGRQAPRRSPRTPAPGSSPVTPPGGSAKKPRSRRGSKAPFVPGRPGTQTTNPYRPGYVPTRPPAPPTRPTTGGPQSTNPYQPGYVPPQGQPSPEARALMGRSAGGQKQPAPTKAPIKVQARVLPRRVNVNPNITNTPDMARTNPTPVVNTFRPAPIGYAGIEQKPAVDLMAAAESLKPESPLTTDPYVQEAMGQPALDQTMAYTLNKVGGRLQKAQTEITKPNYSGIIPPPVDPVNLGGANVLGQKQNADGSTDWLVRDPKNPVGPPITAPRTRTTPASPLQILGRTAGQIGGMTLEALGLPAKGIERIATSPGSVAEANIAMPVVLPGGQVYTPEKITTKAGQPASLGERAMAGLFPEPEYRANQSAATVSRKLYGTRPGIDQAISESNRIGYSGGEAQLRSIARMVEFSEPADSALYGDGDYVVNKLMGLGYLDDPIKAIQADPLANYVYENLKSAGKTDAEIVDVFNTRGLPGEENLGAEMVGQGIMDPLNLVGSPVGKYLEDLRAAGATKFFGPSTRELPEIVQDLRRMYKPFGNTLDAIWPVAKTPTAVMNQTAELGADATTLLIRAASDQAGKADEFGKVRPALQTIIKAYVDSAAPAPVRELFESDDAFRLATEAWQNGINAAKAVLSNYPVANTDAGKIGAYLTRELLTNTKGVVTADTIKEFFDIGKDVQRPIHEVIIDAMAKYESAAKKLLAVERLGAETPAQFAAFTGQAAQAFPTFERGLAGASERVAFAREAAKAATPVAYQAGPLDYLLEHSDHIRKTINSGLWNVFAKYNPGFSVRNALNNLVTALVDGNMALDDTARIRAFNENILGSPMAAFRGIGAVGADEAVRAGKTTGSFWKDLWTEGLSGNLKLGNIPIGAQAVEQEFSQRIVYKAAKDYLDRMMVYGKAIPELPPTVADKLGVELAQGLAAHIAQSYGDVGAGIRWLKQTIGADETWRYVAGDAAAALSEFEDGGETLGRVWKAAVESSTPQEFQAEMRAIRQDVLANLKKAEAASPNLAAMSDDVAKEFSEDAKLADELLGQPENPSDFEEALKTQRLERDRARGTAVRALQQQPLETLQANQADFFDVEEAVSKESARTRQAHDKLRQEAWKRTEQWRSIGKQGSRPKEQVGTVLKSIWDDYFKKRDALWTEFNAYAVDQWNGLSTKLGVQFKPEADWVQEGIQVFEDQMRREAAQGVQGAFEVDKSVYRNWTVNADTGTVEPRGIWVNKSGTDWKPGNLRPPGEDWRFIKGADVPSVDMWREALAQKIGVPIDTPWEEIERAIVAQENSNLALKATKGVEMGGAKWAPPVANEFGATAPLNPQPIPGVGKNLALGDVVQMGARTDVPISEAIPGVGQALEAPAFGARTPIPDKWTPADPRSILPELARAERNIVDNWGKTRLNNLDDLDWKALEEWATVAGQKTQEAKIIASRVGVEARNFGLLNYSDRMNLDSWLSTVFPYHYWYGRTYGNWAKRVATNPAMLANYGRYRQALEKMHAALPDYWQQQLSTDDLGIKSDTPLVFNLEQTLSPLYGIMGSDFTDENRRRAAVFGREVGGLAEDVGMAGPTLWTPFLWALAAGAYMSGDKEAGDAWGNNYLGQQSKAIRAVTAAMNETPLGKAMGIPPGGVNLDPQMFIANLMGGNGPGTATMTQWERNRVANILTSYQANPPKDVDPADWKAQLIDAAHNQSGPLWDKALQEMMAGTAPAVLSSFFFGAGFKPRAEYEEEFTKIYAEMKGIRSQYQNWTPEQVARAYADLENRHPAYDLLMLSRTSGPERDDAWVWEAMSRIGIAYGDAWEGAGVSQEALDNFFQNKTVTGMDPILKDELLKGATAINAVTRPTSYDETIRQLGAKETYKALLSDLHDQFPARVFDIENSYYEIRDQQGPEAAQAYLDRLTTGERGTLFEMWDQKTESLASNPDVARYYLDPERYKSYVTGLFYDEWEAKYPGITDVAKAYSQLAQQGETSAKYALRDDHPELLDFWNARDQFYTTELPTEVNNWLDSLPESRQAELRQDVQPGGQLQTAITEASQAEQAKYLGAGLFEDNQAQVSDPVQALMAQYTASAEAERAAKEEKTGYLSAQNKDGFGTGWLDPFISQFGVEAMPDIMAHPIADNWDTQITLGDVLKYVGDSDSLREAIMNQVATSDSLQWAQIIGFVRSMDDGQLADVVKRYPQLADAAMVAGQSLNYDAPTLEALGDVLGFNVTFYEDGTYSISRQSVKKDKKKTGGGGGSRKAFYSNVMGDDEQSGGGGGGRPRRGRRSYGGGGGGYGGDGGSVDDGSTASAAEWMDWSAQLKLTNPSLLVVLTDYFDLADRYSQDIYLQQHPELIQFLQGLDPTKLSSLMAGYMVWRSEHEVLPGYETGGGYSGGGGPRITRYYANRSKYRRSGLSG